MEGINACADSEMKKREIVYERYKKEGGGGGARCTSRSNVNVFQ